MSMSDQALLSELCSICYTEKPKYRCPRCKTRTCSLPCYKRHSQRASCSGKRDPAEYLKKSKLATPAGIDRDYNYLKNVERSIENAGRETSNRGIGAHTVSKFVYKANNPEGKVQQYLLANRITVHRAPTGMSRQKTNNTRNTKRDNIMWTVEWIHSGGEKDLRHNCFETSSLNDLYKLLQTEKKNRQQVKEESVANAVTGKRRKRENVSESFSDNQDSRALAQADGAKMSESSERRTADMESASSDVLHADADGETVSKLRRTASPGDSSSPESIGIQPRTQPDFNAGGQTHYFYLFKPGTTAASKVLIPLLSQRTLTQSLQDQTVLEYPTIYALKHAPDALPAEFITESQYKTMCKANEKDEDELNAALGMASKKDALSGRHQPPEPKDPPLDANKILDMLRRDINR